MIKNIIFDFDGVIVDSGPFHLKHLNEWGGLHVSPEEFYEKHKGNVYEPKERTNFDNLDWVAYKKYTYETEIKQELDRECLVFLQSNQDKELSIVSSGIEKNMIGFLKEHNIYKDFDLVLGKESDHSKVIKIKRVLEGKDISESIFITDTLGDIKECHEVGIKVIAVDFGFHTQETLREGKPHAICSSWPDVQQVIDNI